MIKKVFSWVLIVLTSVTSYTLSIIDSFKKEIGPYTENPTESIQTQKRENQVYPFPKNDTGRRAGGAEMGRVLSTSILSGVSSTPMSVGVFLNPYTETLNRATLLPAENLWPQYVIIDQPKDDGHNKLL